VALSHTIRLRVSNRDLVTCTNNDNIVLVHILVELERAIVLLASEFDFEEPEGGEYAWRSGSLASQSKVENGKEEAPESCHY
jgi:hypothetical protein